MSYKVIKCHTDDELEFNLNKYCSEEEWIIQDIIATNRLYNETQYSLILFKP